MSSNLLRGPSQWFRSASLPAVGSSVVAAVRMVECEDGIEAARPGDVGQCEWCSEDGTSVVIRWHRTGRSFEVDSVEQLIPLRAA